MCLLQPDQGNGVALLQSKEYPIDPFARKYGRRGYIFDSRSQRYLEVSQLDFGSLEFVSSSLKCIIPTDDLFDYRNAVSLTVRESDDFCTAVYQGGRYNLPLTQWGEKNKELPILDILY